MYDLRLVLSANVLGAAVSALVEKGDVESADEIRRAIAVSTEVKPPKAEVTYLDVARERKEEAKALGAKWNGRLTSWYAPAGTDLEALASAGFPAKERPAMPEKLAA